MISNERLAFILMVHAGIVTSDKADPILAQDAIARAVTYAVNLGDTEAMRKASSEIVGDTLLSRSRQTGLLEAEKGPG
jgi:hypothetical protein